MSVCRKLPDGTIQKIAGHTILLDANASEVRQGTVIVTDTSWGASTQITFTDPMPDNDYVINLEWTNGTWNADSTFESWVIQFKTTTGFLLRTFPVGTVTSITCEYTAFKPIKLDGYTALQNKINNPDNTPTIDSMNLVTSDGVARAIENASAVWKGTKAEWNALPATTKIKYDLAVLIDTQLIKSVDRTDGTDSDVADLTNVWTGTQAQWDAMTQAQRDKWDKALIKDEYVESPVRGVCAVKTLTAGQTSVTFNHEYITDTCFIDVYTSNPSVGYENVTVGTGTCTVTFKAQSANMQVGLRVFDSSEWM